MTPLFSTVIIPMDDSHFGYKQKIQKKNIEIPKTPNFFKKNRRQQNKQNKIK
jgi:hypothetical protein